MFWQEKKKAVETPEALRNRARMLMKQAEDMEKEAFEKVGRAFVTHLEQDFSNFNLKEFANEAKALLSYDSKQ